MAILCSEQDINMAEKEPTTADISDLEVSEKSVSQSKIQDNATKSATTSAQSNDGEEMLENLTCGICQVVPYI